MNGGWGKVSNTNMYQETTFTGGRGAGFRKWLGAKGWGSGKGRAAIELQSTRELENGVGIREERSARVDACCRERHRARRRGVGAEEGWREGAAQGEVLKRRREKRVCGGGGDGICAVWCV